MNPSRPVPAALQRGPPRAGRLSEIRPCRLCAGAGEPSELAGRAPFTSRIVLSSAGPIGLLKQSGHCSGFLTNASYLSHLRRTPERPQYRPLRRRRRLSAPRGPIGRDVDQKAPSPPMPRFADDTSTASQPPLASGSAAARRHCLGGAHKGIFGAAAGPDTADLTRRGLTRPADAGGALSLTAR